MVRVEGGRGARAAAARGDLVVVVDVLSFSTAAATAMARALGAELAVGRADVPGRGRFSLSPRTWAAATPGTRVVLASPNGATYVDDAVRLDAYDVAPLMRGGWLRQG